MGSLFKILPPIKKNLPRCVATALLLLIVLSPLNLLAEKPSWLDETSDEQLKLLYNQAYERIENEVKPAALGVWDSKWFQTLLFKAVDNELGLTWGLDYNAEATKAKFDEGVKFAKEIVNNAILDPYMTGTFSGMYVLMGSALANSIFQQTGQSPCGFNNDNTPKASCIKLILQSYIGKGAYYPMYKNTQIKTLVHEGVHAFLSNTGWGDYLKLDDDSGTWEFYILKNSEFYDSIAEKYILHDTDHCITWGTLLSASTGNMGVCLSSILDLEETLNGVIYEFGNASGEFPNMPYLPGKTILKTDGSCMSNDVNAALDTDGDGLTNDYENNSKPPTNPWTPDTDFDAFSSWICNDKNDRFPRDFTECFDSDNDGVGNMHDACPFIDDCDKDGIGEKKDGQPFNKYCQKDDDGDGLCVVVL